MIAGTFATVFMPLDGSLFAEVWKYCREQLGVDFLDPITEPRMAETLAGETLFDNDVPDTEWVEHKAMVSIKEHRSSCAIIVGRAGRGVTQENVPDIVRDAVQTVQGWQVFDRVIGLVARLEVGGWLISPAETVEISLRKRA